MQEFGVTPSPPRQWGGGLGAAQVPMHMLAIDWACTVLCAREVYTKVEVNGHRKILPQL